MQTIIIDKKTELERLQYSDVPDIFYTMDTQREYLGMWLPFIHTTKTQNDSHAYVESVLSIPNEKNTPVFVIRHQGDFAGLIGFRDTDMENLSTEIGYWLSEPFQGLGLMTKAVRALCNLAFNEWGLNRIQIRCAIGNTKSSNIPRRLGFQFEGIQREAERSHGGEFWDVEIFGLLRSEFEDQARG